MSKGLALDHKFSFNVLTCFQWSAVNLVYPNYNFPDDLNKCVMLLHSNKTILMTSLFFIQIGLCKLQLVWNIQTKSKDYTCENWLNRMVWNFFGDICQKITRRGMNFSRQFSPLPNLYISAVIWEPTTVEKIIINITCFLQIIFYLQISYETRQVCSLFQDLWNKFLFFSKRFKKGTIIKEFKSIAKMM